MKIQFTACIPPIKNAISVDGRGDGAELKLEIPRSDMKAVLALQLMTEKELTVTIETNDEYEGQ